jgi:hypothetical protein
MELPHESVHAGGYTLGGMAREPAAPAPSERPATDRRPEGGEPRAQGERCGAVAIARHAKGDGRALILYTRVGERE